MFQLLSPISLLALAGIALPLILHLRRVRKGKTILVGSLSFFDREAPVQGKSLRLSDLLLLFLRMALMGVLALLLARPFWTRRDSSHEKGWLMVEKKTFGTAYDRNRSLVDSLLKNGYSLHQFSPGFPGIRLADTNLSYSQAARDDAWSNWTLLSVLQQETPPGLSLGLLVSHRLNGFRGIRPVIAPRVHWYEDNFSSRAGGNGAAESADTVHAGVPGSADTAAITVLIYGDLSAPDARYCEAAMEAFHDYTGRQVRVLRLDKETNHSQHGDWLFWLTTQPIWPELHARHVFRYEGGEPIPGYSLISFGEENALVSNPIIVRRQVRETSLPGAIVCWTDGMGRVLLSRQSGEQDTYHFYSRFNPAWSGLPWSPSFPALLMALLERAGSGAAPPPDRRMIDDRELLPDGTLTEAISGPVLRSDLPRQDLSHLCWILAFMLLVTERVLALRIERRKYVSTP